MRHVRWVNTYRPALTARGAPALPRFPFLPLNVGLMDWDASAGGARERQGMVAMAATATATKNIITLRGSTEIVTEFFGAPPSGDCLRADPRCSRGTGEEVPRVACAQTDMDVGVWMLGGAGLSALG